MREMVLGLFRDVIEDTRHGKYIITDYKTALQEKLQSHKITDIKYVLTGDSGLGRQDIRSGARCRWQVSGGRHRQKQETG
ncbi:MAG: hypothetical protein V8Q42_05790 [Anaerovoracaceae bacterium]